jgi:hypothetical protein
MIVSRLMIDRRLIMIVSRLMIDRRLMHGRQLMIVSRLGAGVGRGLLRRLGFQNGFPERLHLLLLFFPARGASG